MTRGPPTTTPRPWPGRDAAARGGSPELLPPARARLPIFLPPSPAGDRPAGSGSTRRCYAEA
eukprot:960327-Alexandrium_andersonii.AAC.1